MEKPEKRILGDTARANLSMIIALPIAAVIMTLFVLFGDFTVDDPLDLVTAGFVVTWPLFAVTYTLWTHLVYRTAGERLQRLATQQEVKESRKWWHRFMGYGNAVDWTASAAAIAVLLTIVVAQEPSFKDRPMFVVLGLVTVAGSWALMVYSFALEYLRLNTIEVGIDEDDAHIDFPFPESPRFGDYLTLTVLLSTMAATVSAKIKSRAAWNLVRANVLLAFTFNSVIVAMMVSTLFGGLTS